MNKKIKLGMGILCTALLFAGCGSNKANNGEDTPTPSTADTQKPADNGEKFERVNGSVKKLDSYRGIEYEPYDTTVTDKEVDAQVTAFLNSHIEYVEITDRDTVQDGDTVNIDYTGYMDGEAFQGGTAKDFNLGIGSGAFIPGFEAGLIGAKSGSTVDVNINFPDPYKNNPDFSGKPVKFTVTIHKICKAVTPEMTDELVAANTDFKTVEDYRANVAENIKSSKENAARVQKESSVMNSLIEKTEFEGIKDEDIQKYYESSKNYYDNLAKVYETYYGYSFPVFLYYFFGCATQEEYEKILKENADTEVKKNVLLYYIVEQESITASEDEIKDAVTKYAGQYGMSEEEFLEQITEEKVKELVALDKAEQLIYDSAAEKK